MPNTEVEIEIFKIMPQRSVSEEISYTNLPGNIHISFEVINIQVCYEELIRHEAEFIEKPITV